ncbi:MAG: UDP-N-acetylglucosamine 2-epimerase (non-hydrolyzing) [Nitrospirae bacterium]|nr:UDP-N-acetylglucosamine 2-epimerase (non-hydrolyzing) [Nitrospirota bacterium]
MIRKKVMIAFGTRPEAIKLAPVILGMQKDRGRFEPYVLATGQHDEMLSQVLHLFEIKPDRNLEIMTAGQTLFDITTRALKGIESVLKESRADIVLVQGDTTTAFAAALAAYYEQIPVAHVEAGLRTHNKYNPFPEEINRRLVTVLADLHFAPTVFSSRQLHKEGIPDKDIFVTGNTIIDALLMSVRKDYVFKDNRLNTLDYQTKRVIVLTMHRRESFGEPMRNILSAVRKIAEVYSQDVEVVFPVHFNPEVRETVRRSLGGQKYENIHLIDPLDYQAFVQMMDRAFIILTDSGGIQEEAPTLGKPVLVLRETTERPEGIDAGVSKLVGTDPDKIYNEVRRLMEDPSAYERMATAVSPYGDGRAAERILNILSTVDIHGTRKSKAD